MAFRRSSLRTQASCLALVAIAASGLVACATGGGSDSESGSGGGVGKVPIGVAFSTGATYGAVDQPGQAGVLMAVKEINDAGGFEVNGKKYTIDTHVVDTTDTPSQAAAAVQGIVQSANPVAMFGPTVSANATVTGVATARAKVINFSAATAWGPLMGKPEAKYYVKTKPPEAAAAKLEFDAALQGRTDIKSAAIVEDDSASGHALSDVYVAELKSRGLKVTALFYPPTETNFSSIITRLQSDPPDLLAAGTQAAGQAGVFNAAMGANIGKLYFSADCSYRSPDHQFSQSRQFACVGSPADMQQSNDPKVQAFAKNFAAYTGKPIDGLSFWSLTQYPYVFALVDAMKAAGTVTDTDKILAKLHGYSTDKTVALHIGDNGEVMTQVEVWISAGAANSKVVVAKP